MDRVKAGAGPPRTIVKVRSPDQALGMPTDDRGEALGWYVQLLIKQELERGLSQSELAEKSGIAQPAISQILSRGQGVGLHTLIAFADYRRQDPGALLSEALEWWLNRGGRQHALDQQRQAYEQKVAESAAGKRKSAQ